MNTKLVGAFVLFIAVIDIQSALAAEFATGGGGSNFMLSTARAAGPSMSELHQCVVSASAGGSMMALNANLCAHHWISPSALPQKFERAYRSKPDRIEFYDLRGQKGIVSPDNRQQHAMNTGNGDCFHLEIPSPTPESEISIEAGTSRFDCATTGCTSGRVPIAPTPPARIITEYKDTGEVRDSVRDALYPRATNQFFIAWEMARNEPGIWGRGHMEQKLKRAICDCEKAGVIDPATLKAITGKLRAPPAAAVKSEADRRQLNTLADEIEGCANPAVS